MAWKKPSAIYERELTIKVCVCVERVSFEFVIIKDEEADDRVLL